MIPKMLTVKILVNFKCNFPPKYISTQFEIYN